MPHPKTIQKTERNLKREELSSRLKEMANDPIMNNAERSHGAMCYSLRESEEETYRCDHCGRSYQRAYWKAHCNVALRLNT